MNCKNFGYVDSFHNENRRRRVDSDLSILDRDFSIDGQTVTKVWANPIGESTLVVGIEVLTKFGLLRTEVISCDFWNAIQHAIYKLKWKIENQNKLCSNNPYRNSCDCYHEHDSFEDIPVITKIVHVDDMTLDEAISRMELLSQTFFIYKDLDSNKAAVVYKRNDGGYGLIEII